MSEDIKKEIENFSRELGHLTEGLASAAEMIRGLKRERSALLAEVEFLKTENKNARMLVAEHDRLSRDRIWTQNRLEKILRKIDSLNL